MTAPTLALPYIPEAEEAVIGAILINPGAFIPVSAYLTADDFFLIRHQYIWQAFAALIEAGDPLEIIGIQQRLKAAGQLENIGGAAYLTHLVNSTPTSVHAEAYGRLVERAAVRRRLLVAADTIKALALDEERPADDILAESARVLGGVTLRSGDSESDWRTLLDADMSRVEHSINTGSELIGVPSGFKALDKILLGFGAGDFIIVAGRPGMGKTSMLTSLMLNQARQGYRVGLFSMEMGSEQITHRLLATQGQVNLQRVRSPYQMEAGEYRAYVKACGDMSTYKFHIDDRPGLSVAQIKAKAYQWIARYGRLDVLYLDYAQLMAGTKAENRVQEMTQISRQLKELARELNIPLVTAAQLSRAVEQRADKRPILSDLRETGAWEQDADVVMFLYRDEVYNETTDTPNQAEVIVAKHRNGPVGTAYLYYEKTCAAFLNAAYRTLNLNGADDE